MDKYWVGGTASWDGTAGTKWALTSGGAGGQAVPTDVDDVFFDAVSGAVTCTVSGTRDCKNLTFTGFAGTFAGTSTIRLYGNLTFASTMTLTWSGLLSLAANSGGPFNLDTAGKSLLGELRVGAFGVVNTPTWQLQSALTSSAAITVTSGTFTTNNFNVTATSLSSDNTNTRTINLGSSTVTLNTGTTAVNFATSTNLTFNAGTSSIVVSGVGSTFSGGGQTFNNVSFTPTTSTAHAVNGGNTYNNLSFAGRTTAGITGIILDASSTISGTLTLSAGTNATMRTFVRSGTIGTTRTLTCAAFSGTDADFRDITIAGAAAPVSGTRLGDCKGNSGITFDAAKTVYRFGVSTLYSGSNSWSLTAGGAGSNNNFPLAQDTAVFIVSPSVFPASGGTVTVDAAYNIGTIDMSARTSNTMTLATGATTPAIYGNWINGTGTTLTGTGLTTFAGRGSQTITSAGKSFTQIFTINTPGGSVALQDALTGPSASSLTLTFGTFNLNSYNATVNAFSTNNSNIRTLAVGSGTLTLVASGVNAFNATTSTNLTVTGTGTISLTSASAKTFIGGGIQTYPTLRQGGTGTLTVSGSNKFAGLTNTAIGRIQFTGGATNAFTSFTINGVLGNLLQLGSTNTTQAILIKPTAWLMGANSTNGGNNTGLSFTAGGGIDYLSVSYINGQVSTPPVTYAGNFFAFF
jgi:hypothetical protein